MRINNPSFEIWDQEPGLDGIYRQIERVGRVCYKSEDHQTADSARPFVERMIKNEHYAMLEHGSVFLTISLEGDDKLSAEEREQKANNYISNRFSRVVIAGGKAFVSTNLRVLAENGWLDDLAFLTEPTDHHERRVTVHFTTQIAITREFNRHRADSMAEQSTRYCNYSKAKFGNEITVNLPTWVKQLMMDSNWVRQISGGTLTISGHDFLELGRKVVEGSATDLDNWVFANLATEKSYMNLIAAGRKPQEARVVLPLDTNTELVHTAFISDWKHFFDLRALGTTGAPHPDAKALAMPLYEEFQKRQLI
jgi:thymidylate synthase (FAD)